MKIALISHAYIGDGASQALLDAASHWVQLLGWEITALVSNATRPIDFDILQLAGIKPVKSIDVQESYSAILVNCLSNIEIVDHLSKTVPIIIWAHEAETVLRTIKSSDEDWRRRFSRAALIIFQTPWQVSVYERYLEGVNVEKCLILPNPISSSSTRVSPAVDHSHFKIVCVGKVTPLKGCDHLIESVQILSGRYSVHCEFIGGLEFLEYLAKPALDILKSSPSLFSLSGFLPRDKAHQHIANSDIFCFPSRSESFGMAPLEAALIGVPVVLNSLPVYQHIGWKSRENCLMYDENTKGSLCGAIEGLIEDPKLSGRIAMRGQRLALLYSRPLFLQHVTAGVSMVMRGLRRDAIDRAI